MLHTLAMSMPRLRMRFVTHRVWPVLAGDSAELYYLKMAAQPVLVECRFACLQRRMGEGWKLAPVFMRALYEHVVAILRQVSQPRAADRSASASLRGEHWSDRRTLAPMFGEARSQIAFMSMRPVVKKNDASVTIGGRIGPPRSASPLAPSLSGSIFAYAFSSVRNGGAGWAEWLASSFRNAMQAGAVAMLRKVFTTSRLSSAHRGRGTSHASHMLRHLFKVPGSELTAQRYGHLSLRLVPPPSAHRERSKSHAFHVLRNIFKASGRKPAAQRYGKFSAKGKGSKRSGALIPLENSARLARSPTVIPFNDRGEDGSDGQVLVPMFAETLSLSNTSALLRVPSPHIHPLPRPEGRWQLIGFTPASEATHAPSNLPALQTYTMSNRTALVYRQVTPLAPVNLTKQVQRIEHQITRKVVHEIAQTTSWRTQVEKALLTPGVVRELAEQVSSMMVRRSGLERYRRWL